MRANILLGIFGLATACSSHQAATPGDDARVDVVVDASIDAARAAQQWHTRDSYSVAGNREYQYTGMAEGAGGALFVAGTYLDAANARHWFLRRSDDAGLSWTNTGWDLAEPFTDAWPYLVADTRGSLYIGGTYQGTWTVYKSTDTRGVDFTVVDSTTTAGQRGLAPRTLLVNARNEVFAVLTGTASPSSLIVRRSDSNGTSWTTILDYAYAADYRTIAFDGTIDSTGGVSVGARAHGPDGTQDRHVIQRSTDNGATWTKIEDFQPISPQNLQERAVLRALGPKLYLAGTTDEEVTRTGEFFVRECTIATTCAVGSWTISDLQPITKPFGPDAGIFDLGQDDTGTLWLTGYTSESHNRKKPPGAPWTGAESELGFNHFGTYLRTSAKRFYLSGMILDLPNVTALVMEYL